jgi:hypothetical protein
MAGVEEWVVLDVVEELPGKVDVDVSFEDEIQRRLKLHVLDHGKDIVVAEVGVLVQVFRGHVKLCDAVGVEVGVVGRGKFVESGVDAGVNVEALLDLGLFVDIAQIEVTILEDFLNDLIIEKSEAEFGSDEGREVWIIADGVEVDGEKMRILCFYYLPFFLLVCAIC